MTAADQTEMFIPPLSPEAKHWLGRLREVLVIPEDKRSDVDYLRATVMLARAYVGAALLT